MRIGTLRSLCAAAVAVALALPAAAQNTESTFEATQGSNAARGAAGEAGTVGPAGQVEGEGGVRQQPGTVVRPGQPGTIVRPGQPAPGGALIEGEPGIKSGTRTANFPPSDEAGQAQGQINDQALVRWIAAGNEAEIRINEFAQQQAQNDQVKQFAQKMVQEHTKLGEQLRQAAQGGQGGGQPGATGRRAGERDRSARPGAADQNDADGASGRRPRAGERRNNAADDNNVSLLQDEQQGRRAGQAGRPGAAMRGGNNPFVALHEEIKRQCAESTIQALREKQGQEFDHSFMHQQVIEHMAMLDTLKVAQNHASQNLRPALQEAQRHTQQHLEQAKQILEQLEQQRQQ